MKSFTFCECCKFWTEQLVTHCFVFLPDSPSPTAARTLTLVAKSVQNLANLVEFGAKVNMSSPELMCNYISVFLCNTCKNKLPSCCAKPET